MVSHHEPNRRVGDANVGVVDIWTAAAVCLLPLLFLGAGFSFATYPFNDPGTTGALDGLSPFAYEMLRGSSTHTLLEWTAVCAAGLAGLLAFVQFGLTREPSLPVIGVALLCASGMDAFHTLAADRLIEAAVDSHTLVPFTGAVARLFSAMVLLVGVGVFAFGAPRRTTKSAVAIMLVVGTVFVSSACYIIHVCASARTLPQVLYPVGLFERPYDVLPLVPFMVGLLVVFPKYVKRRASPFSRSLLISLVPHIGAQLYMAFGSRGLNDSCFNIAHGLKVLAYAIPVVGLLSEYVTVHQRHRTAMADLETARDAAIKASRVKSEFLANMSHELRTPMNSIIGFTHRLLTRLESSLVERDIDALRTVDRNARNLLSLIENVLDLSKIEAGRMELQQSTFDAASLVREVVQQASPLVDGKPVRIVVRAPNGPVMLFADPAKIRQVVTNLVANAAKYTDAGTVCVHLSCDADQRLGTAVRIAVRDTGPGIRQEDFGRLFQQFTRIDGETTRKVGGTGLGLALTDRIVRLHGGRIDVTSEFGRGSEFVVVLPTGDLAAPFSDMDQTHRRVAASPTPAAEPACQANRGAPL